MPDSDYIYLDYAAATPMDHRVVSAMKPYFEDEYFNPSALYRRAQDVRHAVADARETIASVLGVQSNDIFFTAGATESINIAIYGVMTQYGGSIVTSTIEHEAVLAAAKRHPVTLVDASIQGYIDPAAIVDAIDEDTTLVSIGYVNNELGTVQSLKKIAALIVEIKQKRRQHGNTRPLFFHTDASQAAGTLDLSVSRLGVDMMTLNAGKCHGPKQVGLLWKDAHIQLKPLIVGGGQEYDVRSGTENVPGIIGFARALELATKNRKVEGHRLEELRALLISELKERVNDIEINGHRKRYSPHIVHVSAPGVDGERVVYALDQRHVMAATGSACAANRSTGSHVLKAIGMSTSCQDGSLRFSFGRFTTTEEIKNAAELIAEAIDEQRGL